MCLQMAENPDTLTEYEDLDKKGMLKDYVKHGEGKEKKPDS